jgi:DNA end-binding protein Ku
MVSFGLVSIPVWLHPATTDRSVHFHELHARDGSRVQQRIFCQACGKRLEQHEIVKGYEVSRGRYVTVTDEDLASIPLKSLHAIEIKRFVRARITAERIPLSSRPPNRSCPSLHSG